jgi:hypothetical protein
MREENGKQETLSRLCGRLEGGTIAYPRLSSLIVESEGYQLHDSLVAALLRESA